MYIYIYGSEQNKRTKCLFLNNFFDIVIFAYQFINIVVVCMSFLHCSISSILKGRMEIAIKYCSV